MRFRLLPLEGSSTQEEIEIFTTRPDTIFGVSYIVLAPENVMSMLQGMEYLNYTLIFVVPSEKVSEVEKFVAQTLQHTDQQRSASHTGVWTGRYAEHPVTGDKVPVYTACYVLPEFGTGAVMGKESFFYHLTWCIGVPAHDQRDWDFAADMGLEVKRVVKPTEEYVR